MRLLLDTHALLWWLAGDELSAEATDEIANPDNLIYVSSVSTWEISIKQALGKVTVMGDLASAIAEDFEPLAITHGHARLAGELPIHHRDPFDRMLIAQAQIEGLTLVTRDEKFRPYGVALLTA